jgi:hypothetical protein
LPEEFLELGRRQIEPGEAIPLGAVGNAVAALELGHLVRVHQAGVVVLVAGERQTETLDRVDHEADALIVGDGVEGFEHRFHVVPGQIGHQRGEGVIVMLIEQLADARELAEIAQQMLAPAAAALEDEGGIERVGAVVDPLPQRRAVGAPEGRLQPLAVFQRDHAPADRLELALDAREQAVRDDGVEALAVVVDDPPAVADVVLP